MCPSGTNWDNKKECGRTTSWDQMRKIATNMVKNNERGGLRERARQMEGKKDRAKEKLGNVDFHISSRSIFIRDISASQISEIEASDPLLTSPPR